MDMDANFQFVHLQPMAGVRYTLPAYDLAIIGIERKKRVRNNWSIKWNC